MAKASQARKGSPARSLSARFGELLDRAVEAAPASVQQVASRETDDAQALTLVLKYANPEVLPDPLAPARLRGFAMKERLLEQAGGGLTATEAAERLGLSRQAIHKALKAGRLMAYEGKAGVRLLPACQFAEHGPLPGLGDVLAALPVAGFWTRLSFLLAKTPELHGLTPIEALRDGDIEAVLRAARRYGGQSAA